MTAVDETTSGDDGGFAIALVGRTVSTRLVVSTADDDDRVGTHHLCRVLQIITEQGSVWKTLDGRSRAKRLSPDRRFELRAV